MSELSHIEKKQIEQMTNDLLAVLHKTNDAQVIFSAIASLTRHCLRHCVEDQFRPEVGGSMIEAIKSLINAKMQ